MKTRKIILPALAVILVIGLAVGTAIAYFTAHTEATGGVPVALGAKTEIEESIKDLDKVITISNKGPESVWVRAKAYSAYELTYKGEGWSEGEDDFYVYGDIVEAGQTADTLTVSITAPTDEVTEEFNVIVIYECTKVMYDENGDLEDPDWSLAVKKGGE